MSCALESVPGYWVQLSCRNTRSLPGFDMGSRLRFFRQFLLGPGMAHAAICAAH
jgi:hypothetical protein